jgi:4-diphosphocytidyl-2-C-methyl-D-erythritol kinase
VGPIRLSIRSNVEAGLPTGANNLVFQALALLQKRSGCELGADVKLEKFIPARSGLGGGSSDAAAALRLANQAWKLGWSREKLTETAAEIGSDVPYFLADSTAVCRGRGELVEEIDGVAPLNCVIVQPPEGLATADVYRRVEPSRESRESSATRVTCLVNALRSGAVGELAHWMMNRLEAAAATLTPWIDRLKQVFNECGFVAHQLTGSGAAYFGICHHARQARRLASRLRAQQLGRVFVTSTCR